MFVWMTLALQAGLLNMGGLMASQTFVSHVTGFATLASFEYESGRHSHSFGLLLLLFAFLAGSMVSGLLVDLRMQLNKKPKYYIVFGALFLTSLFVVIGGFNNAFGEFGQAPADFRGYSLVIMLCFICGLQNGTVALVSKSVVRTTHLTGITTDLGIGLVRTLNRQRLQKSPNSANVESFALEGKANLMRIGIIVFFSLGSLLGFPIYRALKFRGFIFPCAISAMLFASAFYFQVLRHRRN